MSLDAGLHKLVSGARSVLETYVPTPASLYTVAPASMALVVEQTVMVKAGEFQWKPPTVAIDDSIFIKWYKWDKKAAELLGMQKVESIARDCQRYVDVFRDIVTKRQLVCDELLAQALNVDDDEDSPPPKRRKSGRKAARKAKTTDVAMIPACVEIRLPAVKTKAGQTLAARMITVASNEVSSKNKVTIELSKDVLEYLREAVQGEWA